MTCTGGCAPQCRASQPGRLYRKHKGSADSSFSLITGAAAHDLYHAGQIQLLKKLGAR